MAKIYEFSTWRDAKSIAKSFSLAEIEKEMKSLERYIVSESCAMLSSNVPFGQLDPNSEAGAIECDRDMLSESCATRLSVWKLAYKISKGETLK